MSYTVYLKGRDNIEVDDSQGKKIREMFLDRDVKRTTPISVDTNAFMLSSVTGVWRNEEIPKDVTVHPYQDIIDEFELDLARYSKQSVEEKVAREIKSRIKPGLKEGTDLNEVKSFLTEFFTKNTNYPWCPSKHWLHLFFKPKSQAPAFYKFVVRNDGLVREFVRGEYHARNKVIAQIKGILGI